MNVGTEAKMEEFGVSGDSKQRRGASRVRLAHRQPYRPNDQAATAAVDSPLGVHVNPINKVRCFEGCPS